jgi:ferrous iron transport protein A
MNSVKPLNTLKTGEKGYVKAINISGAMKRRLFELGLIPGTEISCLLKSPSGDPVAYLIRGAVIALRSEETSNILLCS